LVILVDTSVWIQNLRSEDTPGTRRLAEDRVQKDILVGDVILLEVLQGARNQRHAMALEGILREYPVVELLGDQSAVSAARNFRTLRALGITIRKTTDLIIGTWCIEHDHELLHADRDFEPMVRHLGLRTM
jgi:predicted nucleic acid-binding protein